MSEYKYMKELLETASINHSNIIIQEVKIEKWGVVQIFIVEKYKDNVFTITTAHGTVYEPIDRYSIYRVILGKSQVNKLIKAMEGI